MKCYNCDTEIDSNWNFCPNCKRKIKKNKNTSEVVNSDEVGRCHNCSFEMNDKWNFCPVCGTNADFYSDKAFMSVPTIATNTEKVVPVVVPVASAEPVEIQNEVDTPQVENNVVGGKYCSNCGTQISEGHLFCAVCGTSINGNNVSDQPIEEGRTDKNYIAYLIAAFVTPIIGLYLSEIHDSFLLIGSALSLFSMIYVRAVYSKNKIVKTFFIIYIILVICFLLYAFVIVFLTYLTCMACGQMIGGPY